MKKVVRLFKMIMLVVVFVFVLMLAVDFILHIEKYSTTAKYHLMLDLNSGDKEALEYYKTNYTDKGIYLYDGDISFDLFADTEDITDSEYQSVYNEYKNSGLTLQQFADSYNK